MNEATHTQQFIGWDVAPSVFLEREAEVYEGNIDAWVSTLASLEPCMLSLIITLTGVLYILKRIIK